MCCVSCLLGITLHTMTQNWLCQYAVIIGLDDDMKCSLGTNLSTNSLSCFDHLKDVFILFNHINSCCLIDHGEGLQVLHYKAGQKYELTSFRHVSSKRKRQGYSRNWKQNSKLYLHTHRCVIFYISLSWLHYSVVYLCFYNIISHLL
jgi:hypothetical protein